MKLQARQVLSAPQGFIWKMATAGALPVLSGSDTDSWTRFWLADVIPVARMGGNNDHQRAAFGRYVAEAVFWSPASLLPSETVSWRAITEQQIEVNVSKGRLTQSVNVIIDS